MCYWYKVAVAVGRNRRLLFLGLVFVAFIYLFVLDECLDQNA